MDCNQDNIQDHETRSQYNEEGALEAKRNYTLASADDPETSDGCFDCNICLDSAHDPVVTLCGHLYCWACIFEWLNVQTSSSSSDSFDHPQKSCPVCKANISHASLVPLHGRASSFAEQQEQRSRLGLHIPPISATEASDPVPVDGYQYYYPSNLGSGFSSLENLEGSTVAARMRDPAQVMIGELFYTGILWSFMGFFSDPFPGSYYPLVGSRTPRMRRQEMQADKSLNRVSIFLLCCLILCLVTF